MKTYFVASKYFGYNLGGAEKSLYNFLLEEEVSSSTRICGYFFSDIQSFSSNAYIEELPERWNFCKVTLRYLPPVLRFQEVFLNWLKIKTIAKEIPQDNVLITYGLYSPLFLLFFRGDKILMIRDETNLGLDENYYIGMRRALKTIFILLNTPFRAMWFYMLQKSIKARNLRIICNSNFMKKLTSKKLGVSLERIEVIYPNIDLQKLERIKSFVSASPSKIIQVGKNSYKGFDIFYELSKNFPEHEFVCFDRCNGNQKQGNLLLQSWSDTEVLFRDAKVVVIPSRWNEAFCRLAAEAAYLGIPVIASRRGGIGEALEYFSKTKNYILIDDIKDMSKWKRGLESLL